MYLIILYICSVCQVFVKQKAPIHPTTNTFGWGVLGRSDKIILGIIVHPPFFPLSPRKGFFYIVEGHTLSWPQAALMSRPRLFLTTVTYPFITSMSRMTKARCSSGRS